MRYHLLLLGVFLFLSQFLNAQYYSSKNLTTRTGLSQNDITCILQDSYGFMWFGTYDGLNRYDGLDFKKYNKEINGLSSGLITAIDEDKQGNLWVATMNSGINRLNLKTGAIEELLSADDSHNKLISNNIRDLICDDNGTIWYVTAKGVGNIKIVSGRSEVNNEISCPDNINFSESQFQKDKEGGILLMGRYNLLYLDGEKFKSRLNDKYAIFKGVAQYADQTIMAGTQVLYGVNIKNGIWQKQVFDRVNNYITRLIVDEVGSIWVGTKRGLLKYSYNGSEKQYVFDENFEEEKHKLGLAEVEVKDLFIDQTGIIYIGTYGKGVIKLNPRGKKFRHYLASGEGSSGKIRGVFQDSKRSIYIGDHNGAIYEYNKKAWLSRSGEPTKTIQTNTGISCFAEVFSKDKKKRSIIAGGEYNNSLVNVAGEKLTFPEIKTNVFSIVQDDYGFLWVASIQTGIYRFDPYDNSSLQRIRAGITEFELSSNVIRSFCFDDKGNLWIGTEKGINIIKNEELQKENPKIVKIREDLDKENALSYDYVIPIIQTKNKDIWIGTMGEGLNKFIGFKDGEAQFEVFKEEDGLINNVIRAIVEDGAGSLWISTNQGISKFDVSKKTFENYDVNNGLQDYEFCDLSACMLKSGELIFGGVNGINAFYPEEIKKDWSAATPVFTKLSVLNKEVNVGDTLFGKVVLSKDINLVDEITLQNSFNSFSVQLASLHYALPAGNKCKYMLEGFDTDWVEDYSGAVAKYTNLKAGNYTLKLKASNGDGVYNDYVKKLKIRVEPPLLLTSAMFVVYGIIFLLLLMFFRKFSVINIKRKHELTISELEKTKREELTQMKFEFFTNISHEFKTPLTLILNPLESLLGMKEVTSNNKMNTYLHVMQRNAKSLIRLLDQLMDYRKVETGALKLTIGEGNIQKFLKRIHESFLPVALNKKINFQFNSHLVQDDVWFDDDKLEKVINNILSNAFKHTSSGGKIDLELIDDGGEFLTILISDDGEGIKTEEQEKIYQRFFQASQPSDIKKKGSGIGLAYTRSLVELMQGTIEFKSKANEGTVFFVKIPKNKNSFVKDSYNVKEAVSNFEIIEKDNQPILEDNKTIEIKPASNNDKLETLLIVEDNEELCAWLVDTFADDYNVYNAYDGEAGLEQCQLVNPDLIITDVSMPKMNGTEMTKLIKDNQETSHIPIIMLTAYTTDEHQLSGIEHGADLYLKKPCNIHLLKAHVASILKSRQDLKSKFREKIVVNPSELAPSGKDEAFLSTLLQVVEKNISNTDFTVNQLAKESGFNQVTINSKLFALTGQKARSFIRSIRLKRACQLLEQGELSIAEVTYDVGFNDLRYFRECFTAEFGILPSKYAKSKNGADGQSED
ncbi:hybrid sensor histidine kinase/response regulator transcription factor [Saccharicrinis aurantiacus]|uniref:hybrid sensor histidine kinase/response regulator transcription factor n=1 Tax=Saccharicrinis aurantiacus TaxID=1849719 RepID=UPI0024918AD9|nr:two-component regulator propeller domain-containing protein [Saccharicrinis aurantiacus]